MQRPPKRGSDHQSGEDQVRHLTGDEFERLRGVFNILKTDKDTHFTGAIAQYAIEEENIADLLFNKIKITGIIILSDQELDYRVIFFNTNGFTNTDLDSDSIISEQELDLVTYGFQIANTGKYYMIINGLSIDYQDEDATNELHVALQNLSSTSKNAGATGEVVPKFIYELRD